MGRIFWLLLILILGFSVFFWVEDNFMTEKKLAETVANEIEESGLGSNVIDVEGGSEFGFYDENVEYEVYNDSDVIDIRQFLDEGRKVVVVLDGNDLNPSMYNFDDIRMVDVSDYDGEFFYTRKFGMKLRGGFVIPNNDFMSALRKAGGNVMAISL